MSNDSTDHAQEIAEAIQDLCGGKDSYVLVLGDNSLFGCDGIAGLRLLVNHLFDEIYGGDASAERHLMGSGRQPTKQASARRAKLQQALRKLAKASDADFCPVLSRPGHHVVGHGLVAELDARGRHPVDAPDSHERL